MAQPTEYNRQANFTNAQTQAPTSPLNGASVDAEFNAVKVTTDEIRANMAMIQRDDGRLANGSVGLDQLSAGLEIGVNPASEWATATAYVVNDNVLESNKFYRCVTAHTSGTFATDLASGYWVFQFDFGTEAIAAAASAAAALASENNAAADEAACAVHRTAVEAVVPVTAIDGGRADSNYTSTDAFDGGGAS